MTLLARFAAYNDTGSMRDSWPQRKGEWTWRKNSGDFIDAACKTVKTVANNSCLYWMTVAEEETGAKERIVAPDRTLPDVKYDL